MKVSEVLSMLSYGQAYEIMGAYSGKVYHRSWLNKKEHVKPFLDENVIETPIQACMRVKKYDDKNLKCDVYSRIWMKDYHFFHQEEER